MIHRIALTAAALAGAGAAAAEPVAPSLLVEAFNQTCRRGFPDLETIKAQALANGWTESGVRSLAPPGRGPVIVPPQALRKGELTLFLMSPNPSIRMAQSCQVSASGGDAGALAPLAAAVQETLGAGAPEMLRERGTERARWRLVQGFTVHASIGVHGRTRTASIVVRRD